MAESKPLSGEPLIQACADAIKRRNANATTIDVRKREIEQANKSNAARQKEIETLTAANAKLGSDIDAMTAAIQANQPYAPPAQ
jgi:hypothetical protein